MTRVTEIAKKLSKPKEIHYSFEIKYKHSNLDKHKYRATVGKHTIILKRDFDFDMSEDEAFRRIKTIFQGVNREYNLIRIIKHEN